MAISRKPSYDIGRKLAGNPIIFAAARSILILQLAHPLIAQGAKHHSYFRQNPWKRLWQTIYFVHTMSFGSPREQAGLVDRVNTVHRLVHGIADDPELPPGTRYDATDPELLLWVYATLMCGGVWAYEKLVGSLTRREKNKLVAESRRGAEQLGIPQERLPNTFCKLERYVHRMIESGEVRFTKDGVETIRTVLYPPIAPRFLYNVFNLNMITAALLPPRIRESCGLTLSPWEERMFKYGTALTRACVARACSVGS